MSPLLVFIIAFIVIIFDEAKVYFFRKFQNNVENFVDKPITPPLKPPNRHINFGKTKDYISMFSTLIKKKLSDNQVANIFINSIFDCVDKGFCEVAALINEDPVFVKSPNISENASGEFGLIIIVGNLSFLERIFDAEQAANVEKLIFSKLSKIYEMEADDFESLIRKYQSFISRVNHPSKNWIYGMSRAIFHKYKLNDYQDEYFKRMRSPNPLFLKRMDEVVCNYVWNWDAFFKKYRI